MPLLFLLAAGGGVGAWLWNKVDDKYIDPYFGAPAVRYDDDGNLVIPINYGAGAGLKNAALVAALIVGGVIIARRLKVI